MPGMPGMRVVGNTRCTVVPLGVEVAVDHCLLLSVARVNVPRVHRVQRHNCERQLVEMIALGII